MNRIVHPHVPKAASRLEYPVGRVTSAYVAWGAGVCGGKRRPVLIVGARGKTLWVRPIFTLDRNAGLWREGVVDDWKVAGLKHRCYVAHEIVEVDRKQCGTIGNKFSLNDWNRVCRGEVHD